MVQQFKAQAHRDRLNLFNTLPKELEIKVAETQDELVQAYAILHDVYTASEYMQPEESGLRLNIYQALPGTTTFIALWNKEVIATMSTITDSSLGLPMDKIFDLSPLRKKFFRLSETSGLAIKKEYRGKHGQILFPLIKYLYSFCEHFTYSDCMVIAVNPKQENFYKNILLFDDIDAPVIENYNFVNSAPAVGKILDLNSYHDRYKNVYSNSNSSKKNLSNYLFKTSTAQLIFPHKRAGLSYYPVMSAEIIKELFSKRTTVISELSQDELWRLNGIYNLPEYRSLFLGTEIGSKLFVNREQRYEVNISAKSTNNNQNTVILSSISQGGLSIYKPKRQKQIYDNVLFLNIDGKWGNQLRISIEPQWENNSHIGFRLLDADDGMQELLNSFKDEFCALKKAQYKVAS